MQKHEHNLSARSGGASLLPLAGASVTVTSKASGLPASLYSDNGITPLAQPLTTDKDGYYGFYAADGKYIVTYSGARFATFTREILLEDPADNPFATIAQLSAPTGTALISHKGTPLDVVIDTFGSSDVSTVNGVAPTLGNVVLNTDNLAESGTPTNQWFTADRVRGVVLTGLSTVTNAAIAAADTFLVALGKLQAQFAGLLAAKDASSGYAGLTGFAINIKNAAGTVVSSLVSAATVARTWTFPDKSGTVAMTSDIPALSPLTLYAQTADQTISNGGLLTIAHGLGNTPKLIQCFLRCTAADAGYVVGDVLSINSSSYLATVGWSGVAIYSDSTNIYIRQAGNGNSVFSGLHKSNASESQLGNAAWKLFVRVFA